MEALNLFFPDSIDGKNIVITGGSTGLGRATGILLSKLGAKLIVVGFTPIHLQEALHDINAGAQHQVCGLIGDLSSSDGIKKLFDQVDQNFKKLDILINNAAL